MSKQHPDFTDVFEADAKMTHHARRGMRFLDEGKEKEARKELLEATRWEKEKARLEKLLKSPPPTQD